MKKNAEWINENINVLPTDKINIAAWRELPHAEEGHVGKYKNKIKTIYDIVQKYQPKVSAQTGLNAGHSAILILEASDTVLHSFDIGRHLNSTPLVHGILEKYLSPSVDSKILSISTYDNFPFGLKCPTP